MDILEFKRLAAEMRLDIIRMTSRAEFGYLAGCLSCVEILTVLYFGKIKGRSIFTCDPENPCSEMQDYFVLSKSNASACLYSVLSKKGFFPHNDLYYFNQSHSSLSFFPTHKVSGVAIGAGLHGHGLSIANGIALALKLKKKENTVFVLIDDAELQAGQMWEAVMTVAHHKLSNLYLLVEENNLQADGYIAGIKNVAPLQDKFEAFGWKVFRAVDGNDIKKLLSTFEIVLNSIRQRPTCVIIPTIKGKGIPFVENNNSYHKSWLSSEELAMAERYLQEEIRNLSMQNV